ncbi:GNAT family N-acetyltransferase [Henriciella sp.]|uniref:GNAT family N-acetyltransferase n=1 Tax=Henriciella sp. TaxID=1968823 RepID=UPI0026373B64|nr:GNAT family N-acetyltransferase [Henriciella sp.]
MTSPLRIRSYRQTDAVRLEEIFRQAVSAIGPQHYSEEQVSAWSGPRVNAERLDAMYSDGRATFIAVDGTEKVVAFSDMEPDGHIDMLYCDPAFARQGYATALVRATEMEARRQTLRRLFTEASEAAKPVFARMGFEVRYRRDIEVDGVAIHNWAMEKRLAPSPVAR